MRDISHPKRRRLVVVLGPTASGKSELAVKLAKKFNGEVISADSRQVYRGMDIGTGKVPISSERSKKTKSSIPSSARAGRGISMYKGVRHHLIDVASPKRTFTVARYQKLAKKAMDGILKRGKLPIICGGTGFYIDALIYDYDLPKVPPQRDLRRKLEKDSIESLFERLKGLDPGRAENIDRDNKRRLVRALEIVMMTGEPVPRVPTFPLRSQEKCRYDVLKIGIQVPFDRLRGYICKRFRGWLEEGLLDEVWSLRDGYGLSWQRIESFGLEYRQVARYLQGFISEEKMIESSEREICKYAKRQMTWFKRDKGIHWVDGYREAERLVGDFLDSG